MRLVALIPVLMLLSGGHAAAQSPPPTSVTYDLNAGVSVSGTTQPDAVKVRVDGRLAVIERLVDGVLLRPGSGCASMGASVACELQSARRVSFHGLGDDDVLDASAYPFGVVVDGGAGNDRLIGGGASDLVKGGAGNDSIHADVGRKVQISDDPDSRYVLDDVVEGQDGDDSVSARDGETDDVSCGAGRDTAVLDLRDRHQGGCERIDRSDRREGPHVRVVTKRVRLRRGVARIRLRCPRALGRLGCRGTLRLGTRGRSRRYAIRSGRARRVRVVVARSERSRRRLRLTSVERGVHGPKTTIRVLRVGRPPRRR